MALSEKEVARRIAAVEGISFGAAYSRLRRSKPETQEQKERRLRTAREWKRRRAIQLKREEDYLNLTIRPGEPSEIHRLLARMVV